jgi:hypothetical protein
MLSPEELSVFRFYCENGRKYGVAISVISDVDPAELAIASRQQADELLHRSNGKITVEVRQG